MTFASHYRTVLAGLTLAGAWTVSHALDPEWWLQKQVYRYANEQWTPASDFATANQGQLKNLAVAAYEHLFESPVGVGDMTPPPNVNLPVGDTNPAGIGWQLRRLVAEWVVLNPDDSVARDVENRRILTPGSAGHRDFKVINQGQVKAVAKLFHLRLNQIYAPFTHPRAWTDDDNRNTVADEQDDANHALINLGQLKNAFAFDVTGDTDKDGMLDLDELSAAIPPFPDAVRISPFNVDSDGDGLPDGMESPEGRHRRDTDHDGTADAEDNDNDNDGMTDLEEFFWGFDPLNPLDAEEDWDSDGMSNLQELQAGTDPFDPFNGQAPSFTVLSGNHQVVLSAHVTSDPIVVQVKDSSGVVLVGVPVTITAPTTGRVHVSPQQCAYVGKSSLDLETDEEGKVVFYARGADPDQLHEYFLSCQGTSSVVHVQTNSAIGPPWVSNFQITYPGNAKTPVLGWTYTPPPGNPTVIEIFSSVDGENWIRRATLPPTTTQWQEPQLFGADTVHYRVYTAWSN